MTLKDDLERRATRGTERGPEQVYAASLDADRGAEVPTKSRTTRDSSASRFAVVLAGAAAVAVIVGSVGFLSARSNEPDAVSTAGQGTAAEAPAAPATSAATQSAPDGHAAPQPSELSPTGPLDEQDITTNGRTRVASSDGPGVGWIDSDFPVPNAREVAPPIPVYDDNGHQIAWWGFALGWIDLDTMDDPAYDYDAAYRAQLSFSPPASDPAG